MYVFYLEKNTYKFGKINSDLANSIEVALPSGDVKKINKRKNLFILINKNIENFIEKAELKFNSIDVDA